MSSRLSRIQKLTLPSGLTVLHEYDPSSPAVAYQLWIGIGSAHESEREAGLSHFLEHMLFKGTEKYDAVALNNAIENFGGNVNAFTSFEETAYHMVVSSRFWKESLEILLDMVFRSVLDEEDMEIERGVILEELREGDDALDSVVSEKFFGILYPEHPYGRPVIGTEKSIRQLSREDLFFYYKRWYHPANMVLSVSGNVEWGKVSDFLRSEWGEEETETFKRPKIAEPPTPKEIPFFSMQKGKEERIVEIAFPIPGIRHEDIPAIDIVSYLLGEGDMSRLHQALQVRKRLAGAVEASTFTPSQKGQLVIRIFPQDGKILECIQETIAEIRKLIDMGASSTEVQRAKLLVDKEILFNDETTEGRARTLAYYQSTFGDVEEARRYRERVYSVTDERFHETARAYLDPKRAAVAVLVPSGEAHPSSEQIEEVLRAKADPARVRGAKTEEVSIQRFSLMNGARVVLRRTPYAKISGLFAAAFGGLRSETEKNNGISNLMAATMDRGTEHRTLEDIVQEATLLQADIVAAPGKNTLGFKLDVPSAHLLESLDLVGDLLTFPSFDDDEINVERAAILRDLTAQQDYFQVQAYNLFHSRMFPDHPYGLNALGKAAAIKRVRGKDLHSHFRTTMHPDGLVIGVVGDVELHPLKEALEQAFESEKRKRKAPKFDDPPAPLKGLTEIRKPIQGEKAYMVYGFRGVTIGAPHRYALEVLSSILTSSGGGRLYVRLREELGLVYSVDASLFQGIDAGYFAVHLNTSADRIDQAYDEVRSELKKVLDEGVSQEELERVKNFVIGSHEIELQRCGSQAASLCLGDLYGTGRNLFDFSNRIAKITVEDVRSAAERIVTLDQGVLVVLSPNVH